MALLEGMALRAVLGLAGAAAIATAGGFAWQHFPIIGPGAVQHRLEGQVAAVQRDLATSRLETATWRAAAAGWTASFNESERLRREEGGRSQAAVTADARACDARVAEARRTTSAIRTIVTQEVPRDASNCPVRQSVPTDQLRHALSPAAAGSGGPAGPAGAGPSRLR